MAMVRIWKRPGAEGWFWRRRHFWQADEQSRQCEPGGDFRGIGADRLAKDLLRQRLVLVDEIGLGEGAHHRGVVRVIAQHGAKVGDRLDGIAV